MPLEGNSIQVTEHSQRFNGDDGTFFKYYIKSLQITDVSQVPIDLVSIMLEMYDLKSKYSETLSPINKKVLKRQNAMVNFPVPYNSNLDEDNMIVVQPQQHLNILGSVIPGSELENEPEEYE